ncbi:MAG: OmpA family protein [Candidatus Sericytochromatia bacterium]|nr:OmpA family protein [Candidatus Sericytochromatia bacterium]
MSRKKKHGGHANHERWLLTYADLITLLMAFFVILYALSVTEHRKVSELQNALRNAFHITSGAGEAPINGSPNVLVGGATPMDFALIEMQKQIEKASREEGARGEDGELAISTKMTERGLVVSLASSAFFDAGDAYLKPEAVRIMHRVAGLLKQSKRNILVEGHTDNTPIRTRQYPSNWELSTARATSVVRYFVEAHRIPPNWLSAAGYGEYKPIVSNDSPANRAKNRRVDIVILKTDFKGQRPAGQL